jgi:hypothetical protein
MVEGGIAARKQTSSRAARSSLSRARSEELPSDGMQIPAHWAEARLVGKVKGQDRVVRRWGWSDVSADDAQQQADQRAAAAMAELQVGRQVPTREKKRAYGGADLPIREQVVARSGTDVITRNSYGAARAARDLRAGGRRDTRAVHCVRHRPFVRADVRGSVCR